MGDQAREFTWDLVRLLDSPNALQFKVFFAKSEYSDTVRFASIAALLTAVRRQPEIADAFRASVVKADSRATESNVHLMPALRSALTVLDWGDFTNLEIETRAQAEYVLFFLASRLIQAPEGYAQLKVLDDEGFWDGMSNDFDEVSGGG